MELMMNYMSHIDTDHRKLRAETEASRLLLANGIFPVIYITPVNVQLGEEYHPGDFAKIVASNCQLVGQSLGAASTDALNLVFDLPSDAFANENVPSGHLKDLGRMHVAQEVSKVLVNADGAVVIAVGDSGHLDRDPVLSGTVKFLK